MLRLVLGVAGSGKTSLITREISEKLTRGERSIRMLVPEQYSHEAERELCSVCGDGLSLGAEVLSFTRLSQSVAAELGNGGKIYLDAGGRLLSMSLALRQVYPWLRVLTDARRSGRQQQEILAAVEELRGACISYGDLTRAAESCDERLAAKLHDLSLCMEAYESILARGHADSADRLIRLAETVAESSLGKNGQFYIDGFSDFTGAEMRVLQSLIAAGAPVTVCLTCDSPDSDAEHFAPASATARSLLGFAKKMKRETEILYARPDRSKSPVLAYYEDNLFRYSAQRREGAQEALSLKRLPDIQAECEFAAARCIELVRETGCRWRDIAVAVRGFSDYASRLRVAFDFYGVPLFAASKGNITQKPVPALIASAFDVISGGWESESVLEYMKSGLTAIPLEDCDALESYVRFWDLKGGAWLSKSPWRQHPDGFGQEESEESIKRLERINATRRALCEPLERLAAAGASAKTAAEQAGALLDFLGDIGLPQTLASHSAELESAGRRQLADEFSQIWSVLCRALEQFVAILGGEAMTQEEFSELFLKTLSCYDIASIPVSPDAVTAGEIDRMRRRNIRHLIILGASDDRLPEAESPASLLTDDDRELLEAQGLPLMGEADPLSREFSLIYNCVTLPSDTLTLSHSALSGDGAALAPSFLIKRAEALFETEIRDRSPDENRLAALEPAFLLASRHGGVGGAASALAYEYFASSEEGRARLERLSEIAGMGRGSITPEGAERLYGGSLQISPSRADTFFSCRYYYFLRYGLRLNSRDRAGFDPPEMGTYMHYVLEKCASEISESGGFGGVSAERARELVDKHTDIYIETRLGGFAEKSARFVFLFQRLRPQVTRVVMDMIRELSVSEFEPLRFELSFGPGGSLPPIKMRDGDREFFINGVVDRVDGVWKNGRLLLRVVDYKTGKKSFSLSDVWYGMGMQMLLYLFSLEREGEALFGAETVPAGVLYVPARDCIVSAGSRLADDELNKQRVKSLRRSGLILDEEAVIQAMEPGAEPEYLPVSYNKDGSLAKKSSVASHEQMKLLREHVDCKLRELARGVSEGDIEARPRFKSKSDNACEFCDCAAACRFDEERDRRDYHESISKEELWERLEGESDGN